MSKVYFSKIDKLRDILSSISFSRLFVLVDDQTEKHCYPLVKPFLADHILISVKSGEINKTLASCTEIWGQLTTHEADRNALLINLGGGVITDMGGFCAGAYKRGINFINIPTTLLAQVDASSGGKTGVDFEGFKNHIGLFCEPQCVLIDTIFHRTLPANQMRSGFAEMLKHGLIADAGHWEALKSISYQSVDLDAIKSSVAIKQKVTEADPTEKGVRKILNFGHTIGHAFESFCLSNDIPLLHGEAIAVGMIAEAFISNSKRLLGDQEREEIEQYLKEIYDLPDIKKASYHEILRLCKQDKKNKNGKVLMSLLEKKGKATYDVPIDDQLIQEAISYTLELHF
ncbi:3-dehydroquinate synthase [Marivirga lumbricoides]|uniref:3-dehydroquinate synthase n=1 Tax=Marivirga lumbricoides TaxID=1046115 RepID=A0ABQ1MYE0_9BACT|nr:3-dehydroquinate synthase [Marivirga lumbricoides]